MSNEQRIEVNKNIREHRLNNKLYSAKAVIRRLSTSEGGGIVS